jgi:hypothetical protein
MPSNFGTGTKGHSMTQLRLALILVCLLAATTGCRMCASDFEYCGPTVAGGCGAECGLCTPRAGSVLTGASQAAFDEEVAVGRAPSISTHELSSDAFQAPVMPRQMVHGEEIEGVIISVQEKKVDALTEPQTLTVSEAKKTPTLAPTQGE